MLQTKKRYVGYMYESLDQKEPVFDAKGIETVRRDSCPAVSKVTGKPTLLPHFTVPAPVYSGCLTSVSQSGTCLFSGRADIVSILKYPNVNSAI